MNIRNKLAIQFTLIVAIILSLFSLVIFLLSAAYRINDFRARLDDRAETTGKLLITVKEVDSTLLKIIDENTLALYQEHIQVYDTNLHVLYASVDTTAIDPTLIREILSNKKELFFNDGLREVIGHYYKYENNKCVVFVSAYDKFGMGKLNNLKYVLIFGLIISIILSYFGGLFFAARALKPITQVVNHVKKITISNLNLRVDEGNKKDEMAQLAITFNQMLERLEEAFILQRDFVSNAAHELRTPFTILLAEMEFTLLNERTNEEYKKLIASNISDLRNLNNLSTGLLELAQVSFDKLGMALNDVRMDELLINTRNQVSKNHPDYKINLFFDELPDNSEDLIVHGNINLLKIAIKNLIDNGCKFSAEKTIDVHFINEPDDIVLKFSDQGIGISAEDLDNIFQPFFRGGNAKYIAGHGLGLPLILKVINLHSGKLEVMSELNQGTIFTIHLPKKK